MAMDEAGNVDLVELVKVLDDLRQKQQEQSLLLERFLIRLQPRPQYKQRDSEASSSQEPSNVVDDITGQSHRRCVNDNEKPENGSL